MITRRQILTAGASAVVALPAITPIRAFARTVTRSSLLTLKHLHTHEISTFAVEDIDQITRDDIARFNHFMRDHHNGQVGQMDPNLIGHLLTLQKILGSTDTPFEVLSAFRSHKTNAKLRQRSKQVAVKSMHLTGQALDIRLPGVKLSDLHAAALDMKVGGVGLYRRSKFIHFDTGRVRRW